MITEYHANDYAHELSRVGGISVSRLGGAMVWCHTGCPMNGGRHDDC